MQHLTHGAADTVKDVLRNAGLCIQHAGACFQNFMYKDVMKTLYYEQASRYKNFRTARNSFVRTILAL
jgi:hypothetical protein